MNEKSASVILVVFCIIVSSLICISFLAIQSLEEDLRIFDAQSIQVLTTVQQIKASGIQIISSVHEYGFLILAERVDRLHHFGAVAARKNDEKMELNKVIRDTDNLLDLYEKLILNHFPDEKGFINEVRVAVKRIVALSNDIVRELDRAGLDDQLLEIKDDFEDAEILFVQAVERIIEWEKDEVRMRHDKIVNALSLIRNTTLYVVAALLIFFAAVGWLIHNSIVRKYFHNNQ